ncbi:hypothetical protein GCM10011391_38840 [Pullulanibacillus camelliae]|uniref:Uncharacterized protein n=1 Tax=Pullulanibacillus camelliae TaxID=1707096 RepID=A0A8J2YNP5_9BACL|nr:hypothetical protein GCM10011391_38840 [Pullulanibacillus camelliae]
MVSVFMLQSRQKQKGNAGFEYGTCSGVIRRTKDILEFRNLNEKRKEGCHNCPVTIKMFVYNKVGSFTIEIFRTGQIMEYSKALQSVSHHINNLDMTRFYKRGLNCIS